jgi:hydrogenase maturation protease
VTRRALVAGIGNLFFGDDGFGVAVAQRLAAEPVPEGARVADFGIRGVHLAYELLDGYDVLVLVDAAVLGDEPGTVALIEIDPIRPGARADDGAPVIDAHSMSPDVVLGLLAGLGGTVGRVFVVGCQPETTEDGIGLSAPVTDAIEVAARMVCELLADLYAEGEIRA